MRIATFNLENFDDDGSPTLAERIAVMRPALQRINADILCLQEIHSQEGQNGRDLSALETLLAGTRYETGYQQATTLTQAGELYHERNLVTLSRFPITATDIPIALCRKPIWWR